MVVSGGAGWWREGIRAGADSRRDLRRRWGADLLQHWLVEGGSTGGGDGPWREGKDPRQRWLTAALVTGGGSGSAAAWSLGLRWLRLEGGALRVISACENKIPHIRKIAFSSSDGNAGCGDASAAGQLVEENESIASSLPSNPRLWLRCYQGTWVLQSWVAGIVAIQRGGFAPRLGDDVLASAPKCGAAWLKALAFATMARRAHPPPDGEHHPLLRLGADDCVPSMEKLFAAGWGSKIDALPSPRLMAMGKVILLPQRSLLVCKVETSAYLLYTSIPSVCDL
uniref:Uncharacterized protein n=1 Tax=Oryza glumipatula TaxID=40148 RepID=A0A0E0AFP3_9ORYZ